MFSFCSWVMTVAPLLITGDYQERESSEEFKKKVHCGLSYDCRDTSLAEHRGVVEQSLVDYKPLFGIRRVERAIRRLFVHQVSHNRPRLPHHEAIVIDCRHLLLGIQFGELFWLVLSSCQVDDSDLKDKVRRRKYDARRRLDAHPTSNSTPKLWSVNKTLRDGGEAVKFNWTFSWIQLDGRCRPTGRVIKCHSHFYVRLNLGGWMKRQSTTEGDRCSRRRFILDWGKGTKGKAFVPLSESLLDTKQTRTSLGLQATSKGALRQKLSLWRHFSGCDWNSQTDNKMNQ